MDIAQEMVGEVLLIGPKGRLDTETSGELELALHDAFEGGKFHFLIDMSGIGYVSSAGLRVLLSIAKKLESGIGSLLICGLNPTVKQVFDLSGFTCLFKIAGTRAEALKLMPQAQVAAAPKPAPAPAPAPTPAPTPAPAPAPVAAAPVATTPAPARSAAELLGGAAPKQGNAADLAANLLGVGRTPAPAPANKPASVEQATNLLMPSVSAALFANPPAPAPPPAAPMPAPAPAAPAPVVAKPAPAPAAPAQPAAPAADKPAGEAPKKGSWSKLFK